MTITMVIDVVQWHLNVDKLKDLKSKETEISEVI
jgi:hypothetical protein